MRFALIYGLLVFVLNGQDVERRAINYLEREVPSWLRENQCHSCHNNGDAARALYAARRLSYAVTEAALADTTQWVARPQEWDSNRGNPAFSDKKLARIQFAAALVWAFDAGMVKDRQALLAAAESLLPHQDAGGAWLVDAGAEVGSPVTYGAALATYLARRTLATADAARFAGPIARAERWLLGAPAANTPDAAAIVLALAGVESPEARARRRQSVDLLLGGQTSDGGWGPFPKTPAEPFDTAVALLALRSLKDQAGIAGRIARGRAYLSTTQLASGGWPATTRPSGAQSYAQHISTSGWATLALLETR